MCWLCCIYRRLSFRPRTSTLSLFTVHAIINFPQIIISTMCKNNMTSTRNANTAGAGAVVNSNSDYVTTLTVPAKGATASTDGAPKRVIGTRNLSEEDLEALRKEDPFLYYSIPRQVCRSSAADVTTQRNQESALTRHASCPSRIESSSSAMVERKSCISFECHTDSISEDCINDTELFVNENGDGVDLSTRTLFGQLFLPHKLLGLVTLLIINTTATAVIQYCVTISLYVSNDNNITDIC